MRESIQVAQAQWLLVLQRMQVRVSVLALLLLRSWRRVSELAKLDKEFLLHFRLFGSAPQLLSPSEPKFPDRFAEPAKVSSAREESEYRVFLEVVQASKLPPSLAKLACWLDLALWRSLRFSFV